jgi:hypothetical protein
MSEKKSGVVGQWLMLGSLVLSACSPEKGSDDGRAGGVQVAISGEDIATEGISFPTGSEVTIVDGWSIELEHVLVTISNVTLAEDPDLMPSDQSRTGAVVARAAGPWAVDLHVEGSIPAAGGEGLATPLVVLENQTERSGAAFAIDEPYAFSYEIAAASAAAQIVNFDGDDAAQAAYAEMIDAGASVTYIGTARFEGEDCRTSDEDYDFASFPREVRFRLMFGSPVSCVNCQNQDNQGDALPDEEYQRGVAVLPRGNTLAQITLHLEHFLFSAAVHEPSLRFDALAAQLVGKPEGTVLTLDDLAGVDPTAITDASGAPVPFRNCDGSPLPSGSQLRIDTGSVPVDPGADADEALRDYRDFIHYVQSTQGHLNGGEGLCFIDRHYPSPP